MEDDFANSKSLPRKFNARKEYSGKTVQKNVYVREPCRKIDSDTPKEILSDKKTVVSVTKFDQFFQRDFTFASDGGKSDWRRISHEAQSLNTQLIRNNGFEEAISFLRSNAIKISREDSSCYNNGSHVHKLLEPRIVFELPVVDEVIIASGVNTEKKKEVKTRLSKKRTTFLWRGHSYNEKFLYTVNPAEGGRSPYPTFDKIGTYSFVEGYILTGWNVLPFKTKIKSQTISGGFKIHHTTPEQHNFCWPALTRYSLRDAENCKKRFEGTVEGIEFDFSQKKRGLPMEDSVITHIAIMGLPYDVFSYPGKAPEHIGKIHRSGIPEGSHIHYVYENLGHYVSKFDLYYKKHSSGSTFTNAVSSSGSGANGKWVKVDTFVGNTNRTNEILIKFVEPIVARFIKIVPVTYKDSPSMSVRFFTNVPTEPEEVEKETVKYTITYPSQDHYFHGKKRTHCRFYRRRNYVGSKRMNQRNDSVRARDDLPEFVPVVRATFATNLRDRSSRPTFTTEGREGEKERGRKRNTLVNVEHENKLELYEDEDSVENTEQEKMKEK